jgi:branched-chain amino acid transport system substrate-binding protein
MSRAFAFFVIFAAQLLPALSQAERIGVSLPLTGPAATYGVDIKNIFQYLNDLKGPAKHQLLFEDDRCDPKDAVTIAQRFVNTEHLRFVIGYACSGTILATAPFYERNGVVLISAAAAAPSVSQAGDYVFRTRPSEIGAASLLARHIRSRFSNVGLINEETEYAQSIADVFARELGPDIQLQRETFPPGSVNLDSLILKIHQKQPAALVVLTQAESGLLSVLQAVRKLKWTLPFYSSIFPPAPSFLKAAGKDAEGIIFATLPFFEDAGSPEGKALLLNFLNQYGPMQSTDHLFYTTHATFIVVDYLTQAAGDPRTLLYNGSFEGLYGPFSFDSNGDIVGVKHILKKIENGKAVNLESPNPQG